MKVRPLITPRQWDGLIAATGLVAEFEQLSQKLGFNLGLEGDRFVQRLRPRAANARAPQLGEHTDAILHEIGYSASEIGALHDAKVVAGLH